MTETTPAAAALPVHQVTLPDGAVISSTMTPEQRFAAVAKSVGAPVAEQPTQPGMASSMHWDATRRTVVEAPPPPKAPPASPPPTDPYRRNNVEDFDAEMRARGLAPVPASSDAGPVAVDHAGVAALNAAYRAKVTQLQKEPPSRDRDDQIAVARNLYHSEMQEFHEGRRHGESRAAYHARLDGQAPAQPAAQPAPNPDAWTPVESFKPEELSGYRLPKLAAVWGYPRGIVEQLKAAKAAGVTQAQVDAFIRNQAVADGWVPASQVPSPRVPDPGRANDSALMRALGGK